MSVATPSARPAAGFADSSLALLGAREALLRDAVAAGDIGGIAAGLAREPAVAGTAGMRRASEQLADRLRGFGLAVRIHQSEVLLPHAVAVRLERISPEPRMLPLAESATPNGARRTSDSYPAAAGYSAAGDVIAEVVYAHYGRPQDFAQLGAFGVEVRDRIVLVRYGKVFRGAKVRAAELAGAAAVVVYSDPADDGHRLGAVYPEGPFRPPGAVQRGSVRVGPPGNPALRAGVATDDAGQPPGALPEIPVVVAGYRTAEELLRHLDGPVAPPGWQGGLDHRYRLGGGVTARVQVELDAQQVRTIYNTVAILRGARRPDEWVLVGAHRDTWTQGATDNVSGTASVLEVARALADMARRTGAPDRTIAFGFWDAEEWGLIGSGEWVRDNEVQLRRSAVAYINQDGVAGGPIFEGSVSPSLRRLVLDIANRVEDPVDPSRSVLAGLRRRRPGPVRLHLPGGGSDHASFSGRLGIPVASFGFSGPAGVYHSAHDTTEYMRRFGDPGYRQHRASAAMTALLALHLASADSLPLHLTDLAVETRAQVTAALARLAAEGELDVPLARRLTAAAEAFVVGAGEADAATRAVSTGDRRPTGSPDGVDRTLAALRSFAPPRSATDSGWYRHRLFLPDPVDAYSTRWLPQVAAGGRPGGPALTEALLRLAESLEAAAHQLAASSSAVGSFP